MELGELGELEELGGRGDARRIRDLPPPILPDGGAICRAIRVKRRPEDGASAQVAGSACR